MAIKKKTIKPHPLGNKTNIIHRGTEGDKTIYMYDNGDGTVEMIGYNPDGTIATDGMQFDSNKDYDVPLFDRYRIPANEVRDEDKFIGDSNIGKKKQSSPNINSKTFAGAFKQARTAGLDKFTWKGKEYGTRYKNESKSNDTTKETSNKMNSKLTFGKAFDKARKQGLSTFIWRGKKYGTKLKGE